ncbi:unnamed protein product [Moneuplotes crassus]|uniref:Uncharacterized protein n=1 Tax=Euplotes crassus TaxID=5936 RepID=A0AAD1UGY7_EUPCR|nr:unnamed protein product [Moneuplotes crassus]
MHSLQVPLNSFQMRTSSLSHRKQLHRASVVNDKVPRQYFGDEESFKACDISKNPDTKHPRKLNLAPIKTALKMREIKPSKSGCVIIRTIGIS